MPPKKRQTKTDLLASSGRNNDRAGVARLPSSHEAGHSNPDHSTLMVPTKYDDPMDAGVPIEHLLPSYFAVHVWKIDQSAATAYRESNYLLASYPTFEVARKLLEDQDQSYVSSGTEDILRELEKHSKKSTRPKYMGRWSFDPLAVGGRDASKRIQHDKKKRDYPNSPAVFLVEHKQVLVRYRGIGEAGLRKKYEKLVGIENGSGWCKAPPHSKLQRALYAKKHLWLRLKEFGHTCSEILEARPQEETREAALELTRYFQESFGNLLTDILNIKRCTPNELTAEAHAEVLNGSGYHTYFEARIKPLLDLAQAHGVGFSMKMAKQDLASLFYQTEGLSADRVWQSRLGDVTGPGLAARCQAAAAGARVHLITSYLLQCSDGARYSFERQKKGGPEYQISERVLKAVARYLNKAMACSLYVRVSDSATEMAERLELYSNRLLTLVQESIRRRPEIPEGGRGDLSTEDQKESMVKGQRMSYFVGVVLHGATVLADFARTMRLVELEEKEAVQGMLLLATPSKAATEADLNLKPAAK